MAERRQVSGVLQCGSVDTAGKGRDSEAERLKGGRRGKGARAWGKEGEGQTCLSILTIGQLV